MKAGGREPLQVQAGTQSGAKWIVNQADYLYFSGHGLHDENYLAFPNGVKFVPGEVAGGEWKDDLEIVLFAGCSVLDVTGDKFPGNANRPGKAWAKKGPTYFLGYEGSAPGDAGGAPTTIAERWALEWDLTFDRGEPVGAWEIANRASLAWNASVIDNSAATSIAWHFVGPAHDWRPVPETQW